MIPINHFWIKCLIARLAKPFLLLCILFFSAKLYGQAKESFGFNTGVFANTLLNEFDFPDPFPLFEALLPDKSFFDIIVPFKVNQPVNFVRSRKTGHFTRFVLTHSYQKVERDSDI